MMRSFKVVPNKFKKGELEMRISRSIAKELVSRGHMDEAVEEYDKAIVIAAADPIVKPGGGTKTDKVRFMDQRANLKRRQGKWSEALADWDESYRITLQAQAQTFSKGNWGEHSYYFVRAMEYQNMAEHQQALEQAQKAMKGLGERTPHYDDKGDVDRSVHPEDRAEMRRQLKLIIDHVMRLEDKKLSTEKEVAILDSNTAELFNTPRGTSSAPIVAGLFDTPAKAESAPAKPEVGAHQPVAPVKISRRKCLQLNVPSVKEDTPSVSGSGEYEEDYEGNETTEMRRHDPEMFLIHNGSDAEGFEVNGVSAAMRRNVNKFADR
jgi:hypothetical protein